MRVRFRKIADFESIEAIEYYRLISPEIASRFVHELETVIARVSEFPTAGSPRPDGTQRRLLHGFPYVVVYRARERHVSVVSVRHTHRRPRSWRD